jgi:rfaE bifunctional protein nucleotidyltransferase chain/domain
MDAASRRLFSHKVKTAEQIRELIGPRPRKKKVIMCHGTFDVVHPGHVRHLLYAKTKAEVLIASLTADDHIMKGNLRPYVPEDLRAINLAALEMVDYVIIDREPTPLRNLALIQPDFFAKGYEYTAGSVHPKTQEEVKVLESYGGEIIFTPGDIVYSSSALIELAPPSIMVEKLMILMQGENVTFKDLRQALNEFQGVRAHVVGETIVDSYTYCSMIGGMTKTPTMSPLRQESGLPGSSGRCQRFALPVPKSPFPPCSQRRFQSFVLDDLNTCGVHCMPIIDETRPTTNKNAIVATATGC